ncbi:MAG TPA: hypothetical protein V6D05_11430 [Stenomitos sp.]
MATIEDNVGRSNRLQPTLPPRGPVGAPPSDPPKDPKVEVKQDESTIVARPQTEQERQQAVLQAVKTAQAGQKSDSTDSTQPNTPPVKNIADGIGIADGVREGVRVGSSVDELKELPLVGKLVQNEHRVGKFVSFLARSHVGSWLSDAMKNNRFVAPAMRGLGRIAPIAGVVVGGFDIYGAVKTVNDPKAGQLEKGLAVAKGALSGISAVAGVAALFLAPTGIGAAIAGGVALGAGLLSTGADLWLGHEQKQRKEAEAQAKQPAAAQKK